ncbi:hypothetical protein HAX54_012684 [Datura stramonium]|uniref:Uncharacterized protein n=1 Tax=Datura stramonium TaxID=4076 RepID=A0ABS8Y491_DATST|nr:hypothetical protein [Datura stramonium]
MVYLSIETDQRAVFVYKLSWGWVLPGVAYYDTSNLCDQMSTQHALGLAKPNVIFYPVRCINLVLVIITQVGEFILEAAELLKLRETLTRVYVQELANPYGLYPKIWKEMFLCQQQKPPSYER